MTTIRRWLRRRIMFLGARICRAGERLGGWLIRLGCRL